MRPASASGRRRADGPTPPSAVGSRSRGPTWCNGPSAHGGRHSRAAADAVAVAGRGLRLAAGKYLFTGEGDNVKNDQTKPKRRRTLRTPARPEGEDWAPDFLASWPAAASCARQRRRRRLAAAPCMTDWRRTRNSPQPSPTRWRTRLTTSRKPPDDAKGKSDKLAIYFLNLRYRPRDERKRGRRTCTCTSTCITTSTRNS